jgi:anti-anti-sigma regulatory factor
VTITLDPSGARGTHLAADHPDDPADTAEVTISTAQVDLLSVAGWLNDKGLTQLRMELQALFDAGTRHLVLDLARVSGCDHRLFDVLGRAHQILTHRQGWVRLVGVGPAVHNALDDATLSESLLVYQASDWTSELAG